VDGNKRAAFAAMNIFLEKNGFYLVATEVDATLTMLKLAAGAIDEDDLAAWIESNIESGTPGRHIPG
jgi:death-on-curing protein